MPVTGGEGGGATKLGRYVSHWSVQELGVGGSAGREAGRRGKGGALKAVLTRFLLLFSYSASTRNVRVVLRTLQGSTLRLGA